MRTRFDGRSHHDDRVRGHIDGILLPKWIWNTLAKDGIETIEQLARIAARIERVVPGIGQRSAEIIRAEVARILPGAWIRVSWGPDRIPLQQTDVSKWRADSSPLVLHAFLDKTSKFDAPASPYGSVISQYGGLTLWELPRTSDVAES
jgi:hypothetical protein